MISWGSEKKITRVRCHLLTLIIQCLYTQNESGVKGLGRARTTLCHSVCAAGTRVAPSVWLVSLRERHRLLYRLCSATPSQHPDGIQTLPNDAFEPNFLTLENRTRPGPQPNDTWLLLNSLFVAASWWSRSAWSTPYYVVPCHILGHVLFFCFQGTELLLIYALGTWVGIEAKNTMP